MPDQLTTQILDPDPSDAAVVGTVLGARGDIQFDEDGSVSTITDGQTEIDVTFLYEKVSDDYRFIENYIESPIADLRDVRCVVRKEDRKTTGFKVQLSSEHVPAGSIYRWHIKVRDALQVTQPPESQPRYVLGGAFQPLNSQLTMLSVLPVQDFGLGALNIANAAAFRAYIGAATSSDIGGPYVSTSFTLTEGAGLAGHTYDFTTNRTLALGTPSTLTVASTNSVSGTTHSHAITSSSNPGAAASILATDSSGFLTIPRLTATGYIFVNNATANLYLKDTSTGWQSASSTVLTPLANNSIRSTSFTSGLVGWNVNAIGDAEFNNLRVRGEILASVFKVSELSATAGTFGVFFSAANLSADFTTPNVLSTSFTFHAKNSDAGGMLFGVGDILRFKGWTGSGIADAWATVASRTNNGTTTTYSATLNSGSTNVTFNAGTAVVDYGPSGTGFITLSTDGTVGSSPNLTMATHAGTPWSGFTTLMRSGNLNGSYGYATNVYGVGIGQYGASDSWLTFDTTNGIRIGNNTSTLAQWDTSGNILVGKTGAGQGNVYITSGAVKLRNNTTDYISLDASGNALFGLTTSSQGNVYISGGTVSIRRGTTDYITLSATDAQFTNLIKMTGSSAAIAIGSTPPTSATVGTGIWLDRAGLYALSSNTQNTTFTSAGITAGGGSVVLSATGISITSGTSLLPPSTITWKNGTNITGFASNSSGSGTGWYGVTAIPTGAGNSVTVIGTGAQSNASGSTVTQLITGRSGSVIATELVFGLYQDNAANETFADISDGGIYTFLGLSVGGGVIPAHMLDVYGTGWFQGHLSIGSSPDVGNFNVHTATNKNLIVEDNADGPRFRAVNDANNANVAFALYAMDLRLQALPTSDPGVPGQLYRTGGDLRVSI